MSEVAVPGSVLVVPSPQFTVIPVTVAALETVKVTVTIWPMLAGLGAMLLIVATGGLTAETVTATDCEVEPMLPWLSVTVSITVKLAVDVGL